jgi:2-keto-4-pentenoate hydratase/2-oxohepta-3-ene-1,7-dioic acid hydratase in catechol pathway
MDGRWFETARDTAVRLERDASALDDAREKGWLVPIFSQFSSCVIAPGEPVVIPVSSEKADYEAELAVVIGRRASHVTAERAYHHVLGYTAFNDVTARDFPFGGRAHRGARQSGRSGRNVTAGPWMTCHSPSLTSSKS